MTKILIIEDDTILAKMMTRKIEDALDFDVVHLNSMAQAKELLETDVSGYFLALMDLYLPDAPNGEIIDLVAHQPDYV